MFDLKNTLARKEVRKSLKVLYIVASAGKPMSTQEVVQIAKEHGWRDLNSSRASAHLNSLKGKVAKLPGGWDLTNRGQQALEDAGLLDQSALSSGAVKGLEKHLSELRDRETIAFLEEAIGCIKNNYYRSAIVLSWVGAVSVLHQHVLDNHLSDFNKEAISKNKLKKPIRSIEGFQTLKERDFLDLLPHISVVDKNTKAALVRSLDLRNSCGHPNSFKISEAGVAAHVETLILNVFERF